MKVYFERNNKFELLFMIVVLSVVFLGFEYDRIGDFHIYWQAAMDTSMGFNAYIKLYGDSHVFDYYGSPVLSVAMLPFTKLPANMAAWLWKVLSIVVFVYTIKTIRDILVVNNFNSKIRSVWYFIVIVSSTYLWYYDFHYVQFTCFLLFSSFVGTYLIHTNKNIWIAGALISAGILTKPITIVVVPYFMYRKHFKGLMSVVISMVIIILITSMVLGMNQSFVLWQSYFERLNPTNISNSLDLNYHKNHGLTALVSSLLMDDSGYSGESVTLRRHVLNLPISVVLIITTCVKALLIVFTLFFLKSKPFKRCKGNIQFMHEISYILMCAPLIFPQQRPYNFLLIFPALCCIVHYLMVRFYSLKETNMNLQYGLFIISVLLINLELYLGHFRRFYWHYKVLTYGVLIIMVLLVFSFLNSTRKNVDIKNEFY